MNFVNVLTNFDEGEQTSPEIQLKSSRSDYKKSFQNFLLKLTPVSSERIFLSRLILHPLSVLRA